METKIKSLESSLTQAQNEGVFYKERITTLDMDIKKETNRANKFEGEQKHLESQLKIEIEKGKEFEKVFVY